MKLHLQTQCPTTFLSFSCFVSLRDPHWTGVVIATWLVQHIFILESCYVKNNCLRKNLNYRNLSLLDAFPWVSWTETFHIIFKIFCLCVCRKPGSKNSHSSRLQSYWEKTETSAQAKWKFSDFLVFLLMSVQHPFCIIKLWLHLSYWIETSSRIFPGVGLA